MKREVVEEIGTLLGLAKKGRKRLKGKEINSYHHIDPIVLWSLMKEWSERVNNFPKDVLRLIFQNMTAFEYWKIATPLSKKFRACAKDDITFLYVSLSRTDTKRTKNGGTSLTSRSHDFNSVFYNGETPFLTLGEEITSIKRKQYKQLNYMSRKSLNINIYYKRGHEGFITQIGDKYDYVSGKRKNDGKVTINTFWKSTEKNGTVLDESLASSSNYFHHLTLQINEPLL